MRMCADYFTSLIFSLSLRKMLRAYKYALLPTDGQREHLSKVFGCCRVVYNLALETRNTAYASGKVLTSYDLQAQLPELKQEFEWLTGTPSQALQQSIMAMDVAFTNFFKKRAGFPRFKSKYARQSFRLPQGVKVDFDKGTVKLPKIGMIPCVFSRRFEGKVKTCTVSKTPTGKHFISILVETGKDVPAKRPISRDTAVGIDLGIKEFATCSEGTVYANRRHFVKMQRVLRKEQRKLARCKKGSKRREKQRRHVARLHERIANQRNDLLHKVSTEIVKNHDTICIEDLHTAGMLRNPKLAKHIADAGWRTFRTYLEYKCEWYGKNLRVIGRFEPSSKMCSACGNNQPMPLSARTYECGKCGFVADRDVNAAVNIRNFGMIQDARGRAIASEAEPLG